MDPQQTAELNRFFRENFYYILGGSILLGLLFGLAPLILGIKKGKRSWGLIAFVVCGVCGAISPILSLVVAIVATVIILRGNSSTTVSAQPSVDDADLPS
jgi:hypothetical protein